MDLYYYFGPIGCDIVDLKLFGSDLMHYHIVVDKDGNTICKTETEEMAQNLLNEGAK